MNNVDLIKLIKNQKANLTLDQAFYVDDYIFDLENDTYYCSEVIYQGFQVSDSTQNLFAINPMTFNEPNSKNPFVHWVTYYEELNAAIPEGELGLNPGGMSRSEGLDIIYMFEKPSGYVN